MTLFSSSIRTACRCSTEAWELANTCREEEENWLRKYWETGSVPKRSFSSSRGALVKLTPENFEENVGARIASVLRLIRLSIVERVIQPTMNQRRRRSALVRE